MADKMMRIASRNHEGKARALKSNENDSLIVASDRIAKRYDVERGDFKGKKTGILTVPHIAYVGLFNEIEEVTVDHENWSEFSNNNYDYISEPSEQSASNSSNDKYVCHLFSFNLLELLKNTGKIPPYFDKKSDLDDIVKNFSIRWLGHGYGNDGEGVSIKLYNYVSGNFSNYTVTGTTNLLYKASYIGFDNNVRIVDSDGYVHALVYSSSKGGSNSRAYLSTNYVEICDIEFIASYPITDSSAFSFKETRENESNNNTIAYDEMQDRLKVSVEDSTTRKLLEEYIRWERQGSVVENLFKGELEPDEYVNNLYSLYRGEKETRILVSTDQEGFRMIVGAGPFDDVENFYNGTTYPNTFDVSESFTEDRPLHVLPIYRGSIDVDENTTWEQAYQHRQLNDFRISFRNTASEKANVTIKIMRIFK